ncbi:16 kDa beta-galactoside-binding lectin-like [Podarcis raffonei]|uniref:16 kDa beta-galactoside-binding lectin-like n=1 Tax=Podarcis raffonei TaxID=65483 RepID=UPI0023299BAF|nr:16 kDa beta-galactoside-binding lectin-like [Podarcis raffonei]
MFSLASEEGHTSSWPLFKAQAEEGRLACFGVCQKLSHQTFTMETQMVFSHLSIKPGECIKVKGKVPPEAKSFALNLCHDDSDTILHFNPRFDSHGDVNTIVCNSKTNGQWDSELRESLFPFQQGEDTKICLSFDYEAVTVKINGDQEVKFPNRLGANSAKIFSVEGDIAIKSVKFE